MTASHSPSVRMMELTDGRLGDIRYHQWLRLQQWRRPSLVAHIHVAGEKESGQCGRVVPPLAECLYLPRRCYNRMPVSLATAKNIEGR